MDSSMTSPGSTYLGILVLMIGWADILSGGIGWYANIGLLIGTLLYCFDSSRSIFFASISLLVALSSLFFRMNFHDGGAFTEVIAGYDEDFYCWLAAYVVLLIGTLIDAFMKN